MAWNAPAPTHPDCAAPSIPRGLRGQTPFQSGLHTCAWPSDHGNSSPSFTMPRRTQSESLPEMLVEVLTSIFQALPPWTSIPVGLFGFCAVDAIWCSSVPFPQLQFVGLIFGAGFAALCFIAGWNGVSFRRRQRAFLGANLDLNWVDSLSWQGFERQLASVYRQNGWLVAETGGGGPDGGVDLRLFKDGRTILVHCKHWRTWKVSVRPIRELYGVMTAEGAHGAIFITSRAYTAEARKFAEGKPIELIDQDGFLSLVQQFHRDLRDHYGCVPPATPSGTIPAAGQENPQAPPECPVCQSPMKLRTSRKGARAGSQFWGCSRYPACRGTRNA